MKVKVQYVEEFAWNDDGSSPPRDIQRGQRVNSYPNQTFSPGSRKRLETVGRSLPNFVRSLFAK